MTEQVLTPTEAANYKNPFVAKDQKPGPGPRIFECWMIHYGGDAYLELTAEGNYAITKDMRSACRFPISDYNERLTSKIRETTALRPGFGPSKRMRVRWEQGTKLTALNEVIDQ